MKASSKELILIINIVLAMQSLQQRCFVPNCESCAKSTISRTQCDVCIRGFTKKTYLAADGVTLYNLCEDSSDLFWWNIAIVVGASFILGMIFWIFLVKCFINSREQVAARNQRIEFYKLLRGTSRITRSKSSPEVGTTQRELRMSNVEIGHGSTRRERIRMRNRRKIFDDGFLEQKEQMQESDYKGSLVMDCQINIESSELERGEKGENSSDQEDSKSKCKHLEKEEELKQKKSKAFQSDKRRIRNHQTPEKNKKGTRNRKRSKSKSPRNSQGYKIKATRNRKPERFVTPSDKKRKNKLPYYNSKKERDVYKKKMEESLLRAQREEINQVPDKTERLRPILKNAMRVETNSFGGTSHKKVVRINQAEPETFYYKRDRRARSHSAKPIRERKDDGWIEKKRKKRNKSKKRSYSESKVRSPKRIFEEDAVRGSPVGSRKQIIDLEKTKRYLSCDKSPTKVRNRTNKTLTLKMSQRDNSRGKSLKENKFEVLNFDIPQSRSKPLQFQPFNPIRRKTTIIKKKAQVSQGAQPRYKSCSKPAEYARSSKKMLRRGSQKWKKIQILRRPRSVKNPLQININKRLDFKMPKLKQKQDRPKLLNSRAGWQRKQNDSVRLSNRFDTSLIEDKKHERNKFGGRHTTYIRGRGVTREYDKENNANFMNFEESLNGSYNTVTSGAFQSPHGTRDFQEGYTSPLRFNFNHRFDVYLSG